MFNKVFASSVVAAITLSSVVPAFAYVIPGSSPQLSNVFQQRESTKAPDRPTRRSIRRSTRDRDVLAEIKANPRDVSNARPVSSGVTKLYRARLNRMFRRINRSPKSGYDRYRILHRPNTRYFRQQAEDQASLPSFLVQTGGNTIGRPSRRSIRGTRDRDILKEMRECSVRGVC